MLQQKHCLDGSLRSRPSRRVRAAVLCRAEGNGLKKVVVLGGTGRVGSSTASSLLANFKQYDVKLASRSRDSYHKAVQRWPRLQDAGFVECNIHDKESVKAAIAGADLVLHTAGPFQHSNNFNVIEAALETKTPYMDVCDDTHYSESIKSYHDRAVAAGIPALTTAGIYPGTSNVMAAHMLSQARGEYDADGKHRDAPAGALEPEYLRYSYYTAGSGGAGRTILETSYLLCGEDCRVYKGDKPFDLPPVSNRREVDFGPGIGRKGVYLFNLPEVASAYKYMKVPGVSARFGTDPAPWNWAMWLIARLWPKRFLKKRSHIAWLVALSEPLVRLLDTILGFAVAMRIELDFKGGKKTTGLFCHRNLPEAMGNGVAAFAHAMLQGQTQPGVWYPEEKEALADRPAFLEFAAKGCFKYELSRPGWELETPVKQLGGLIYW